MFVWFAVVPTKWNNIQKTYKNHQNPLKSYCFLGYFFSWFNFGPNPQNGRKSGSCWLFCHPRHPQRRSNSRNIMVFTVLFEIFDLWCHLAIFLIISKMNLHFPFIGFSSKKWIFATFSKPYTNWLGQLENIFWAKLPVWKSIPRRQSWSVTSTYNWHFLRQYWLFFDRDFWENFKPVIQ